MLSTTKHAGPHDDCWNPDPHEHIVRPKGFVLENRVGIQVRDSEDEDEPGDIEILFTTNSISTTVISLDPDSAALLVAAVAAKLIGKQLDHSPPVKRPRRKR